MITNAEVVTIFNGRLDTEERRKKYIPTVIKDVSYVEGKGSTVTNSGVWSDDVQYKIRVPFTAVIQDGRSYVPELEYAKLDSDETAKYWTIQKSDLVIKDGYAGEKFSLYEDELTAYAKEQGLDLIKVTEYADNTSGGSLYLKHWRIGGK